MKKVLLVVLIALAIVAASAGVGAANASTYYPTYPSYTYPSYTYPSYYGQLSRYTGLPRTYYVHPYFRSNGTYVHSYWRSCSYCW
jgi:hypothetical protein